MNTQIVQSVIKRLEGIAAPLLPDLGHLGHALTASVQHDSKFAFDRAVAAGEFAANTFVAIGKQEMADYWGTVKSEIAAEAPQLLAMVQTNGMQATVDFAAGMLKNINWRAVGIALTGVGMSTLKLTANATLQMLITGVLVAA